MFITKKLIFKTVLPLETVKTKIEKYSGYSFRNNQFMEKGGLMISNNPMLGNMAMINGSINPEGRDTIIHVNVELHPVGKVAIIIGLFFGVIGLLFAISKSDISQLVGLIPIGIIYPLVLISYSFDLGAKINTLKKAVNIL